MSETRFYAVSAPTRSYFAHLETIDHAVRARDYHQVIQISLECVPLIESLVRDNTSATGDRLLLSSIPPLQHLAKLLPVKLDLRTLGTVLSQIDPISMIEPWKQELQKSKTDCDAMARIYATIRSDPGIGQSAIWKRLQLRGNDFSDRIRCAEHMGYIQRTKSGKSYELHPTEDTPSSTGQS